MSPTVNPAFCLGTIFCLQPEIEVEHSGPAQDARDKGAVLGEVLGSPCANHPQAL